MVADPDAVRRRRAYVFTDDHSSAEVEAGLRSIIESRAEVVVLPGNDRSVEKRSP